MKPFMDVADVAEFFLTSAPTVGRWVKQGELTPRRRTGKGRKWIFAADDVRLLLPPKVRDMEVTLVTSQVAAAKARAYTDSLDNWAKAGVLTAVFLPCMGRAERRYVLEEIVVAARVPTSLRMCTERQLADLGISPQELQAAIAAGKLVQIKDLSPPRYSTVAVRRYLVGRLYDTD